MRHIDKLIFLILSLTVFFLACDDGGVKPLQGFLEISYQLEKAQGVQPSYQTAIWLENEQGELVRSLLVSEYLSYGGYNDSTICPDWSKLANWSKVSPEEFDAVTAATPGIGNNVLKVDCRKANLLPGKYIYCVQVHILENYNMLYEGEIMLNGENVESIATAKYIPRQHPLAGNVLSHVKARYIPG